MAESIVAADDHIRLLDNEGATRAVIKPGATGPVAIFLDSRGEFAGGLSFNEQTDQLTATLADARGIPRAAIALADDVAMIVAIDPDGNPTDARRVGDPPHDPETLIANPN